MGHCAYICFTRDLSRSPGVADVSMWYDWPEVLSKKEGEPGKADRP